MKSKILPVIAGSFGIVCLLQLSNLTSANASDKSDVEIATTRAATHNSADTLNMASNDINTSLTQTISAPECLTGTIAEAILNNKVDLNARLLEIEKREKGLKALNLRLQSELENIETVQANLEQHVSDMRAIADSDLLHLVEMYSTMKPGNAAEIFDNMPAAFAAGFLREIDGARAGMIMSEMSAKKSFEISLIIANSNANWR